MNNLLKILILTILIVSCKNEIVERPENLIPEEKMVNILFDIAIVTANNSLDHKVTKDKVISPEEYVYEKYKIDSLQLAESTVYYSSDPDVQLRIFEKLEKQLETLKTGLEEESDSVKLKKPKALKRKNDSLKTKGENK